jgi:hypothetical protein
MGITVNQVHYTKKRLMSYLPYLCLFAYSGVQHIACCVFLRIVYPMLPVFLDCPFFIAQFGIL